MLIRGTRLVAACAILSVASLAAAQTYPARPVKILVGANAGGGTDIIARMLADKFQGAFGQPFVVENKPGASNTIAADATAKAAPDGHTLLVATNTGQAIAPHLIKLSFDTNRDLIPVALIVVVPNVLIVAPNVPANNVRDLIALIKAKPDAYAYGSSGVGSTQHLAGEAFNLAAGTKAVHVPYKGSAQALSDLVGGQIQLDFDTTSSAMAFIKGGKVRALAVMSPKRTPELPDVPTLAEAGVSGAEVYEWNVLLAPAGTPDAVMAKLSVALQKAMESPEVRTRIAQLGGEIQKGSPDVAQAFVRSQMSLWAKVVKERGIALE